LLAEIEVGFIHLAFRKNRKLYFLLEKGKNYAEILIFDSLKLSPIVKR
jgi:hypothetical protein